MIVKMKKISIVVLDLFREQSLRQLRKLGTVHIEHRPGSGEQLSRLQDYRAQLDKAILLLPAEGSKTRSGKKEPLTLEPADEPRALSLAQEVADISERIKAVRESLEQLRRQEERLAAWGDFEPEEIRWLENRGITIKLYELTEREYQEIPDTVKAFIISRARNQLRVAVVSLADLPVLSFAASPLPERGMSKVRELIGEAAGELTGCEQRLQALSAEKLLLQASLAEVEKKIDFELVRTGMEMDGPISYLSGFIPSRRAEALRAAAAENGWALLVDDPTDGDSVPTLVENPKWIQIIQPVFRLLGTVPGYREYDISFWFLLFFSLFFAMLIGDAGYGLLLFGITLYARLKMPKSPAGPFFLLFVLAVCTIIWGALTGTWFGVEAIAKKTLLSKIIIPRIATFGADNAEFIMLLCFLIGTVHLSIAHIINFMRNLPRLAAFGDLGWLSILWGMFLVIRWILLKQPLNPATLWLIAGGLAAVTICGEQKGNFIKGFLLGLAKLPIKMLNSISAFSDIVSYVRLFAVGLAGIEIAKSFNAIGAEIGFSVPLGFMAALILFFGHALNIAMGAMSVIVHGIRLNMLEFSGHLGMEWTGTPYKPFSDAERRKD